MSSLRSKRGLLQIYKSRKNKKWKVEWKTYFFKVTGSTYFHYFRQNEAMALDAKPKDQIFIKRIIAVEIPPEAPKNGNFVFEVHHSAGGSSPWILSADSEEERLDWMETIKPNSTTMLHSSQIKDIHQRNKAVLKHATPAVSPQLRSGQSQYHGNKMVNMATNKSPNMQHRQLRHAVSAQDISSLHPKAYPNEYSLPNAYQLKQSASRDCSISQKYGGGRTSPLPQTEMMPHSPKMDDRTRGVSRFPSPLPLPLPSPVLQLPPPEMLAPHSPKMSHPSSPLPLIPTENSPRMDGRSRAKCIARSPPPLPLPILQVSSPEKMPYSPKGPRPCSLPVAPPAIQLPSTELTPPNTDGRSRGKSMMITGSPKLREHKALQRSKSDRPLIHESQDTCQVDKNGDELTQSGNQYIGLPPQIKFRFDDICLLKEYQKADEATHSPFDVTPPTTPMTTDPIFGSLQSQFTGAQIQALAEMLAKMNDKGGGESEANVSAHFNKTADTLTEAMLVTDNNESFDEIPKWATANIEQVESLPDTNTVSIPRTSLTNMKNIGAGNFGDVYSAIYTTEGLGPDYSIRVAVKIAKNGCTEAQKRNILQEVSVMTNMVHPNLVKFYGINKEDPDKLPWLVMEYMPYGNLKDFLKNSPTKKSPESLVKYMVDVAMGMHYIAERGLVHRDLAARNVLVGHGEICKVADFGLLRELSEDDSIYVSSSNIPCPIRWMPPEAISKSSFSVASDVWSFGILQWEMMNPGKLPYANFGNYEVVSKISEGYRMPTPRGCPPVVARIMKSCWHADPKKRPSFLLITTLLTTKFTTQQATSNRQNGASPKLNDNVYICMCNECDSCLSNSHFLN